MKYHALFAIFEKAAKFEIVVCSALWVNPLLATAVRKLRLCPGVNYKCDYLVIANIKECPFALIRVDHENGRIQSIKL